MHINLDTRGLFAEIISTPTEFKAWVSNYIHINWWYAIKNPSVVTVISDHLCNPWYFTYWDDPELIWAMTHLTTCLPLTPALNSLWKEILYPPPYTGWNFGDVRIPVVHIHIAHNLGFGPVRSWGPPTQLAMYILACFISPPILCTQRHI